VEIRFRILSDDARLPEAAHDGDAGLDLRSTVDAVLPPGGRALVPCGLAVEIPPGHAGFVIPRSGLAARHGITILNAPGLVDSGYRGELKVALLNTDQHAPFAVAVGDRIAQLAIVAMPVLRPVAVEDLSGSDRGSRGFGSSGVR
jgi:dUTP pyrophosphatase